MTDAAVVGSCASRDIGENDDTIVLNNSHLFFLGDRCCYGDACMEVTAARLPHAMHRHTVSTCVGNNKRVLCGMRARLYLLLSGDLTQPAVVLLLLYGFWTSVLAPCDVWRSCSGQEWRSHHNRRD